MAGMDGHDEVAPAPTGRAAGPRLTRRRVVTVAVALGAAAGVGVGATALAGAATSPTTTQPPSKGSNAPAYHGFGGHFRGGPAAFGGGFGGAFGGGPGGGVIHGQYTIKGPKGYETLDERSGTVSAVSDASGSVWSLTVKSADGTSGTFTVNASSSVNGGESGIASVKVGDKVNVVATVSGTKSTATEITDQTTLQANGKSWMPFHGRPVTGNAGTMPPGPGGGAPSTTT
jgi:hypothetical protein